MRHERLLDARRTDAAGRLAGGVAHDFNNLLAVIEGFCDLAQERSLAGEDPREELEEIRKAVDSATAFTSDLLAFSRRQLLRPKVLDPGALLSGMRGALERLAGKGIEVRMGETVGSWSVRVDPEKIERAITNLAVRARSAMPKGGTLAIETANVDVAEENAWDLPELPRGEYVRIRVSDNGGELDSETLAHVFEPFFAAREGARGAGLGLAAAHGIVTQCGGTIRCSSEAGGTTFEIYLPREGEDLSAASPGRRSREAPAPFRIPAR